MRFRRKSATEGPQEERRRAVSIFRRAVKDRRRCNIAANFEGRKTVRKSPFCLK